MYVPVRVGCFFLLLPPFQAHFFSVSGAYTHRLHTNNSHTHIISHFVFFIFLFSVVSTSISWSSKCTWFLFSSFLMPLLLFLCMYSIMSNYEFFGNQAQSTNSASKISLLFVATQHSLTIIHVSIVLSSLFKLTLTFACFYLSAYIQMIFPCHSSI